MEWKPINELPKEKGLYECYFPESIEYEEHHREIYFDGKHFLSGYSWKIWLDVKFLGKPIDKWISHWMKIERP